VFLFLENSGYAFDGFTPSIKQLKLYINQRRVFMLRLDAKYCDKISFLSSLFPGPLPEACTPPPLNSSNASFVRVAF